MAPKKKPGRKKEEAPKEPEIDDDIVPEHSREFYLIQIRDLEGRLAKYQKKWDEMQVSEDLFRKEYDKIVRDNKEIVAFLKKTLNQRVDEIAELTVQLQNLQIAKDTEKDAFEAQLVQLRHEFQETKDQLTLENMTLSGKLASLEEFRVQKDEIMGKFADLEDQLKKQEADHKEYVYNLEKKAVLDKERLKKEMLHRVNVVASEFRKVSDSQMAETTKRAIRENAIISLQLTKITDQSLQLIQENDRLKATCAELTKQLSLLEQTQKTMAKNSRSKEKLITMLTNKCKELQAQADTCARQQKALTKLQEAKEALEKQLVKLKAEMKIQKEKMERNLIDQQNQVKRLQEEQQRCKTMEFVLRHAAQGLKEILRERPAEEYDPFDVTFQLWRNDMLQGLLKLLDKGATHIEEQEALHPFLADTKEVKSNVAVDGSHQESFTHLKPSRLMSHCQLSKRSKPWSVHSMPSFSTLSQDAYLDPLHPCASALESLISWKQEEEIREREEVIKEEYSLPEIITESASEKILSVLGKDGDDEFLTSTESTSLQEAVADSVGT
ncbi:cilia- and flagella-associated protein 157 [Eublepharis macularius]|uniref:Cilia- and flagella-associated protein 157 n=1 Tax=Eublepharis macularius TaxID=481883 RepID=A0AA97LET3_EUBMA|nr:cilia- and flagella-associated protein 157 [Eublepharis macularius]